MWQKNSDSAEGAKESIFGCEQIPSIGRLSLQLDAISRGHMFYRAFSAGAFNTTHLGLADSA
jgi:hypothetical protein